jgi:hypothetical protein
LDLRMKKKRPHARHAGVAINPTGLMASKPAYSAALTFAATLELTHFVQIASLFFKK